MCGACSTMSRRYSCTTSSPARSPVLVTSTVTVTPSPAPPPTHSTAQQANTNPRVRVVAAIVIDNVSDGGVVYLPMVSVSADKAGFSNANVVYDKPWPKGYKAPVTKQ